MNYIHNLTTDSLKGEVKISALKYNYIVLGAETAKENYKRKYPISGTTKYDFEARTNSYYIQDEIELQDFVFTLGTRLDDSEKFGNEWSSNVGAVYKIDDKQRLKLSYGEGFKTPSLQESSSEYQTYSHGWYVGNDDLKAETSKSYELAYEFYGEDTKFKTAIFKTDLDNLITGESTGRTVYPMGPFMPLTEYTYVNVAKATIKGFEADVDYDFNENHKINLNYTYLKTEDKETNEELSYRPKNTFNIGLSSELGWGVSSYLSANYLGTQYDSSGDKISGYTLFNAQISKKITKDLTARIGVDNIGDKHFDDNGGDPYYLKRRLAYVGLNYKF